MKRNESAPSPPSEAPGSGPGVQKPWSGLIRDKAENLYLTRQFYCTESVLVTLNRGFGGGLTDDQAIAVAAPFLHRARRKRMHVRRPGRRCSGRPGFSWATRRPTASRKASPAGGRRQLHDRFKARFRRCLLPGSAKKSDRAAGEDQAFKACARVTADAAEMTARQLLGAAARTGFRFGRPQPSWKAGIPLPVRHPAKDLPAFPILTLSIPSWGAIRCRTFGLPIPRQIGSAGTAVCFNPLRSEIVTG